MIRESRYDKGGWGSRLQFAVMRGKSRQWLYQRDLPDDWVQEYRNYVEEAKGRRDKDGKFRGAMMIVADIEEENERLKKIKQPTKAPLVRPEAVLQKTSSPKRNKQVSAKKEQTSTIKKNKEKGYYAKKKVEKTKRLDRLRANYASRLDIASEESRD
jgi:hypothetical protein